MHRHCDLIEIANRSNLTDSFCSGIIQTNNHALYKTPTYYIQELYATQAGQIPVTIQMRTATDSRLPTDLPDLGLDCSATLTADKSQLILFAVNHTNVEQERTIDISAFGAKEGVAVLTVSDSQEAGERDVTNSWQLPERVHTRSSEIQQSRGILTYRFPPLSVTCLRFQLSVR
jgi:alpha-L-arabinofuranosidase